MGSKPALPAPDWTDKLKAPERGHPAYVDAVPGELTVDFHLHDEVEDVSGSFLTAVTFGLNRRRQRELAVTLRLAEDADVLVKMRDIVRFFLSVRAWAVEGNLVDAGGFTVFGERGLFGRARSGVIYADARPLAGVELPERALAAIVVDAAEIRVALDFGVYRVLTRMAVAQRVFPFPTWSQLDRASAVTPSESQSRLANVPRLRAPNVWFQFVDESLHVSVPSGAEELMRGLRALPSGAPFALLTRPSPDANAILVWNPGQDGVSGVSPHGSDKSRLSGSCLIITPAAGEDRMTQSEDGYSLSFTAESWARLTSTLVAERPFQLRRPNIRLEISFRPKLDPSPN